MNIYAYIKKVDYPEIILESEYGEIQLNYSHLSENANFWNLANNTLLEDAMVLWDTQTREIMFNVDGNEILTEELKEEEIEITAFSELKVIVSNMTEEEIIVLEMDGWKGNEADE